LPHLSKPAKKRKKCLSLIWVSTKRNNLKKN
jgi:hypothetical protein